MSFVLIFIGQRWPKTGYSSNWLSTALFEYHITIMSKLSGAKLSICQEFISNYLSMLHDSTEIQKRSFCHLHYPFHFIVVPNSYWGNWINLQVFNDAVPYTNVIDLVVPHRRYCTAEGIFVGICLLSSPLSRWWKYNTSKSLEDNGFTLIKSLINCCSWFMLVEHFHWICNKCQKHVLTWHWLPCIQLDISQDLYGSSLALSFDLEMYFF